MNDETNIKEAFNFAREITNKLVEIQEVKEKLGEHTQTIKQIEQKLDNYDKTISKLIWSIITTIGGLFLVIIKILIEQLIKHV